MIKRFCLTTAEFNKRFLEHKGALFAYILGFLKNQHDAEDVLQDLYLKLWRRKKKLNQERCKYYFFSSAKTMCIDFKRKIRPMSEISFHFVYDLSLEDSLEKQELSTHFRKAIKHLPERSREVLYLKDVCRFELHEVVDMTDLTVNNVRVILSRSRKMVKEELAKIYRYEKTE